MRGSSIGNTARIVTVAASVALGVGAVRGQEPSGSPAAQGSKARAEGYARTFRLDEKGKESLVRLYVPYSVNMYSLWKKGCELDADLRSSFHAGKLSNDAAAYYLEDRLAVERDQRDAENAIVEALRKELPQSGVALFVLSERAMLNGRDCSILKK